MNNGAMNVDKQVCSWIPGFNYLGCIAKRELPDQMVNSMFNLKKANKELKVFQRDTDVFYSSRKIV